MKSFFFLGMLAVVPLAARANDSSFEGIGGSMRPTRGEDKAIRMVRETVVLTANATDYSTQADFVFANETGRAQNVSMGFPEGNFGDVPGEEKPEIIGFRGFSTSVDGRRVAAKRTILKQMDSLGFNSYWVKTVPFSAHQTRHVRVQFRSPYGSTVDWGMSRVLSYAFTGANWRGNVGESVLEVRVAQPGLWRAISFSGGNKILPFALTNDKTGATFRHVWKNWNAQQQVTFGLERTIPYWRKDEGTPSYSNGSNAELRAIAAAQTFRVGPKPKGPQDSQGFPVEAFTNNGTLYVGVNYLKDKLESWGDAQTPKFPVNMSFAPAAGFDLRAGKLRLQGKEGDSTIRINGKTVAAGAPVVANLSYGKRVLYVPFAPLGRALGWKLTLHGERLFSLERGNWKG